MELVEGREKRTAAVAVVDVEALAAKEVHVAADEEDRIRWLGWVLEPPWSQCRVEEIVKESWYATGYHGCSCLCCHSVEEHQIRPEHVERRGAVVSASTARVRWRHENVTVANSESEASPRRRMGGSFRPSHLVGQVQMGGHDDAGVKQLSSGEPLQL